MTDRFARRWTCLFALAAMVGAGCVCVEAVSCRGCCGPHVGSGPASDGPDWCDCDPARRPAAAPALGSPPALPTAILAAQPTAPRPVAVVDTPAAAGRRPTDHHRGRAPPRS